MCNCVWRGLQEVAEITVKIKKPRGFQGINGQIINLKYLCNRLLGNVNRVFQIYFLLF